MRTIRNAGLAHIPEDRRKHGLIMEFTLAENSILAEHDKPPFAKGVLLDQKAARAFAREKIDQYHIKAGSELDTAASLSGGNQQKVVIARELAAQPELVVAVKPTRGLDVGAVEYIHTCLLEQRDQGKGVLLISAELEEIMTLSDRIMVLHGGEITGIVYPDEVTTQELGLMMAGEKSGKMAQGPREDVSV